jgi:hypothetical protein
MAIVDRCGGLYVVAVDGEALGQFMHLLDAHCFAMQLLEREMVQSVRLYSGTTVT